MTPSSDRPLRIVVMGTGPFAVPMFRGLLSTGHAVVAVVTRPARSAPGRRPPANPMRDAASAAGLPILDPADVNAPDSVAALEALAPDLLVVCDYGQILAPTVLATAPYGGVNLHGSLLPRHRGAAPVQWAILAGDPVTGVSVIHMTPALDAGHVLVSRETAVGAREMAGQLEARLADLGSGAVAEAIDRLLAAGPGARPGVPQDPDLVTRAPRLAKADGLVDWSQPADRIERMCRALDPWPRTTTFLHLAGRPPLRLVLDDVAVAADTTAGGRDAVVAHAEAGTIVAADAEGIVVACGQGTRLVVRRLVPEGKRTMSAADFLRGHPLFAGARLG